MSNVLINGIVAVRNGQPYLQIDIDGHMVQMSMAEARNVARDIECMCARTEADAMMHRFFNAQGYPPQAGAAVMVAFREFRSKLDAGAVEKREVRPSED